MRISTVIICFFSFLLYSIVSFSADFDLPLYDGWGKETISIPLSFAPEIKLSGIEELRFSPGMFSEEEQDYWSYLFVWWLEEDQLPKESLEENLGKYFTGLAAEIASFKKIKASGTTYKVSLENNAQSIFGRSSIVEKGLISEIPELNIKIDQYHCEPQKRLAVVFELSPKPFEHLNWQILSKL